MTKTFFILSGKVRPENVLIVSTFSASKLMEITLWESSYARANAYRTTVSRKR